MTKEKIRFLIGLMLLAVFCFIGFQWYVIREAILVRNDQFNLRVAEAVQSVVHRLEKDEILFLLQHRIDMEHQRSKLKQMTVVDRKKVPSLPSNQVANRVKQTVDTVLVFAESAEDIPKNLSNADVLMPHFRSITDYQTQVIEDFFKMQRIDDEAVEGFMREALKEQRRLELELADMFMNHDVNRFSNPNKVHAKRGSQPNPNLSINTKAANDLLVNPALPVEENPLTKEELLKDVIREIVNAKRPLHERVNRFLLDSMLKKEFQQSGINLPYEFAVKKSHQNEVLFTTAKMPTATWDAHAYKTTLFATPTSNEVNQLYVYFPGKEQFVMGNVLSLLMGSGVMVLAVLGIFYIAISTIVKQKKLSEMKNDFINNMTHEFKTPISTIALAVDMAKDSPDASRFLTIIKEENNRLGNHVEKVLQTALIDRGELQLNISSVDMHDVIVRVLNGFAVTLEQKKGEVDLEFEANVETVQGDEVHLLGIIRNLIDNAIKYSSDKVVLRIATSNVNNGIQIDITDQGMGMTKEDQDKVFEKFYRVSTGDRHDVKGFGLGLSYAKEMVHLHRGSIDVTSKPSEGSTFTIWLPHSNT